jgi:ribosomal 30S subunit maturation factor RimM
VDRRRRYAVVGARPIGGAYLLALEGVTDRDAAAALRGQVISVDRDQLDLDDDDVLYADLVGCRASCPTAGPGARSSRSSSGRRTAW